MSNQFETEKFNSVIEENENNAKYFTEISDTIVTEYTQSLDNLMKNIYDHIVLNEPADDMLEHYSFELNNCLYFIGDNMEKMGIRDDLSKITAKEVYNDAYINYIAKSKQCNSKCTVAELTALAEGDSKYETIMNSIYSRAYKQIKYKVDAGYEMLSTIKKIISKRMQDQQLTMMQRNTLTFNNEGE